jgi:methionine-rich copper-binding protein CopC
VRSLLSRRVLARALAATLFLGAIVTAEPGRVPDRHRNAFGQTNKAPKLPKTPKAVISFGGATGTSFVVPTAAPAAIQIPPPITATLRDSLAVDTNADGQPGPGDTLTYTATIAAGATDATGVTFSAPLDANTTLVPGSVTATPVGVNDSYAANRDTALTRPAAAGVLVNDFAGLPAATVTGFQTPTPHGGTVTIAADGGFTYTPASGYTGPDSFTYTLSNAAGSNTATVSLDVLVPALAADDSYAVIKDTTLSVSAPGLLTNDVGTPAPAVTAATGPTTQGGSMTVNADGSFIYTPPAGFVSPPSDTFSYTITNSAGTSSATASLSVDARPTVDARMPVNGATNVPTDANITVTFSEPVIVTGQAFALTCPGPITLVNVTGAGPATSFVLDPSALLPANATCTVSIVAAEVADADPTDPPDHLLADDVFSFSTDAAPSVVTTVPADTAVGIPLNQGLTVTFSEPVTASGDWFQIVCSASGTRTVTDTAVNTADNITYTIDPTVDFTPADICTMTVLAAKVSDTDANDPPDTIAANHVFTFTMDAQASVSSSIPAAGAVSIATNANLTIAFSEPVNVTGNWFQIVCGSSGTRNVADTNVSGGPTYVIDPATDFTPGELCTVTVFAANVTDVDANDPPDAMAADHVFAFTLEAAPSIVTSVPADNAVNRTTTENLILTFSEPVNVTGNWFQIVCTVSGTRNPADTLVTGGPTTWTIDSTTNFTQGESCTATVFAAGVTDQDAVDPPDTMTADVVIDFTIDAEPSVITTAPVNGATDQAGTANLSITFSEPVNVTGNWFQIVCTTSGTRNPADTLVGGGPTTFTIDPTTDFVSGESCTTTIVAALVSDQDGNDPPDTLAANHVFTFAIDAAPSVATTGPLNAATGITLTQNLSITFTEPVNVTGNWFQIVCTSSGTRNPADTNVGAGPMIYTIDPTSDFTQGESCTATVFAALVSDQDANDPPDLMLANHVWTFAIDQAPSVTTTSPANGAISIATNVNLAVTFSEPVNADGLSFSIPCTVSGSHTAVVSGGPTTFTLDPDVDFAPGEVCTVAVLAANVTDVDANDPPDTMLANYVFSFTLEDAPSVIATVPASGADHISTTSRIRITFSEPVIATNASVAITCTTSGAHTVDNDGDPSATYVFDVIPSFDEGETCTVTVLAAQVADEDAIDPPDAMLANHVFSFTVDEKPAVTATAPVNGASDQLTTTDLSITFSEPVNVTGAWFAISCTTSGAHTAVVTGGPTTFTLNPDADFAAGETCTITIVAARVRDQDAGDPPDTLAGDYVFSFAIDAAPSVTTTVPANTQTGVVLDADLTITFSEAVDVTGAWFAITCSVSGVHSGTVSGGPTTFTIDPGSDFAPAESCTAQVIATQVTDQDTNDPPDTMVSTYTWTFATDAAPAVAATTPANGAVSVPSNANVDITFTEPVNAVDLSFLFMCTTTGLQTFTLSGGPVTFTLDRSVDFAPGEVCTVTAVGVAVNDQDLNDPPNTMLANYVFSFTVEIAPFVQSSTPADAGVQGTNQNFTITFNEPVNVTGNWFAIACPSGTQNVADTVVDTTDNTTFTINPNADFITGEGPCTLTVTASLVTDQDTIDPFDTMVADAVIGFTIDVPPAVQTTDPANGAINALPAQDIRIAFDEPVNVSGSWFSIGCMTTGSHTATVSGGPTTFTLNPDVDFATPEACTVTIIGAQVTDQDTSDSPDAMAADYVFSFLTDAPPSVTATSPLNGAVDQAGNTNLSITFSEAVNVTANWFTISCATSGTHAAAVAGGPTTFTLDPGVDFASAELCTVTILAAEVTDQDGTDPPDNPDADYTFSFTIDAAPQVTTTVPANGATNLAANTTITINFTESVNVAAGGVTIGCPGAVTFTPPLPQNGITSLVLTPTSPLPFASTCTVSVVAANVSDFDTNDPPNLFDGNGDGTSGDDYTFQFTVDAAPRVTLPTSPANGATNQATNINLTINFNEPVDLAAGAVTLGCPAAVPFIATPPLPATNTTSVVIDPISDLPTDATCTVTVLAANVADTDANDPPDLLDGNADGVPGDNYAFSFSTDAAPSLTTTTPSVGATDVPATSNITLSFSELVNIAAGGITVECPVSTPIDFTPALPQGPISSIVLDPTTSLPGNTTCTVTVVATGVTDADANDPPDQFDGNGNGVPGDSLSFTFVTAPEAADDSYPVSPHLTLTIGAGTGVKTNDSPTSLTITGFGSSLGSANATAPGSASATSLGGTVTLAADGSFVYFPPPDVVNQTDHFFYTVTAGDTADVSLVIQNQARIWFLDREYIAATNGPSDGTQARPFFLLTGAGSFDASALPDDNTNDWVFIKQRPSSPYTCGLSLTNTQKLVGDGAPGDLETITGVTPVTGSSLPFFNGVNPQLTVGGTANCITVGQDNRILGMTLITSTVGATAVAGTDFGTLTISDTTISGFGRALNLTNGALAVTLDTLASGGGTGSVTNGITLSGVGGTLTPTDVQGASSIVNAAGASISITGGTVSLTYMGNITQSSNAPLLSVSGGHSGTLTFQNRTLNAANGPGLQFDNADGTYNFDTVNGTTILNGADAGIDITNGSSGTFNFGRATSPNNFAITSPTGTALNVNGSSANVAYRGNITQANNAAMVAVTAHTAGTISFQNGTLSATNGTGLQFDDADGSYIFNTTAGTTALNGGDAGIDITNGSSGTFNFGRTASPASFAITSPTGTAFSVSTGAPAAVYSGTILQNNAQPLIAVSDTTGGSVTFDSPSAASYVSGGTGIVIDGAAGNVTVNNGDLNGTRGITILGDAANNAAGTFTFNNVTIDTSAGATNHAFVVDGDQGTATNNDVAAVIDLNNVDITNPGGLVASIQGMNGGSIDFDSASAITRSDGGLGIDATSNAGGTISINSTTKTLNTGANAAVTLLNNTGAAINFAGGNLDIDTTSGGGFNATGGGTVTIQGTNNTVNTTTGIGVNIANTSIGVNDVTLLSVSSNGASSGIVLNGTGSELFTVTGDATTINNGSGGTIEGSTGAGISLTDSSNVSLDQMIIQNGLGDGILGSNVTGFSLTRSTVTNNGDELQEHGADFTNLLGASTISASTFSNNETSQITIVNTTAASSASVTLDNVAVSSTGPASAPNGLHGLHLETQGSASADLLVQGSAFTNLRSNSIHATNEGTGTLEVTVTTTTFNDVGESAIDVAQNSSGPVRFNIDDNGTFLRGTNAGSSNSIDVTQGTAAPTAAVLEGRISNNVIGNNLASNSGNQSGYGISVVSAGAGTSTVQIDNNDVQGTAGGIRVQMGQSTDSAHTMNATINDNTVLQTSGLSVNGIRVNIGVTTNDAGVARIDMYDNDSTLADAAAANFGNAISISTRFLTSIQMPGYTGGIGSFSVVQAYLDNTRNNDAIGGIAWDISKSASSGGYLDTSPAGSPIPLPTLPSPLLAAGGEGPDAEESVALTVSEVTALVEASTRRLSTATLSGARDLMRGSSLHVGPLPPAQLGARSHGRLTIDSTAAGWGWFVDPTPDQDEEFGPPSATGERIAKAGGPAEGKIDLLTALMHELAHGTGESDLDPVVRAGELMTATLPVGVRRGPLPVLASRPMNAAALMPFALSGETVTVNVGTLPAGKSVVIRYQATIATAPITGPGFALTHQGGVTGTNFTTIITDDPDTADLDDATRTAMACPVITIAPADLEAALFGVALTPVTFTASGGIGTTTLALTGTLPSGVTFDAGTATLSGTPTESGIFALTVTATDQNGCEGTQNYTLRIGGGRIITTGADALVPQRVRRVTSGDGRPADGPTADFLVPGFIGGVRVAEAEMTGDGTPDIIAAPGPGAPPRVVIFDGVSGAIFSERIVGNPGDLGGLFVAAGDVDGDGRPDLITGAGSSSTVRVFSGASGAPIWTANAFAPSFTGGVRVAAGDIDGDGHADIITTAGAGDPSMVKIFGGASHAELRSFVPYPGFTGGAWVASGDVNGDGYADVITGAGPGGGPHIRVFDGRTGAAGFNFLVPGAGSSGVRVAAGDVSGDGRADIITTPGPGGDGFIRMFDGVTGALAGTPIAPTPSDTGGHFVSTAILENRMVIDVPAAGATVSDTFRLSGWVFEEGAAGTGVDAVDVWAFPLSGAAPEYLGGATLGDPRPDVGAIFGARYTPSGYHLDAAGLAAGQYDVAVYAHSSVSGLFNISRVVRVQVVPPGTDLRIGVDLPQPGRVNPRFRVAGYAFDAGVTGGGTGIDAVDVWATPPSGASIYLGPATLGDPRSDVANSASGFHLDVADLAPGDYSLAVFVRSAARGSFAAPYVVPITVAAWQPVLQMQIDLPGAGPVASGEFQVGGWALVTDGPTTPGIDAVHVWAYPVGGGGPVFVGAALLGGARPDVASLYGPGYENPGFNLLANLPAGTWDLAVFARITGASGFSPARTVRIIVP